MIWEQLTKMRWLNKESKKSMNDKYLITGNGDSLAATYVKRRLTLYAGARRALTWSEDIILKALEALASCSQ